MTDDMLSWTRQQIEARKALAESASPSPWSANAEHDEVLAEDGERVADGFALSGNQLRNTVDHIVFNDPRQIIADCEADLGILDDHEPGWAGLKRDVRVCMACDAERGDRWPCRTVRRIAAGYQYRPGYRPEWAPERMTS